MTVAPLALSFAATEGSAAPGAQTITVRNTGPAGTTLTYTGTKSGSWLTASGNVSQPLASGQSAAFTVTVNHAGLAPGTYTGSVNFAATSITSTATVAVTLVVSPRQTPPQGSGLTGTWRGTWTRRPNGFCDVFTNDITWNLVQNGNNVTGTYTHTVTVAQPDQEWCPNNVGHRTTGTFAQGTISSNTLTIFLEGGTRFVGTFDSTTITGTTPGSGIGTGSFTVRKQ